MPGAPLVPPKLRAGDLVRVVAPSLSLAMIPEELHAIATRRLESLGLRVSFGRRVREVDELQSSSVASRVADLHEAFEDGEVRGIFSVIGGFNANQLLRALDWELIARNPKVFCGYSDITVLQNAMLARSGLVTYSGPHFSTFAMEKGIDYDLAGFRRCCMDGEAFDVEPSPEWSDDAWYLDQENRTFLPNPGPATLREGVAEGTIVGGNLCTLNLLQGSEWMPSLDGAILFLEDDAQAGEAGVGPETFDRDLQSLLLLPGAAGIRGLVIGRFQQKTAMTPALLRKIVDGKPELAALPVACGFDFGHTTPHFTFPVGGTARLDCGAGRPRLTVGAH